MTVLRSAARGDMFIEAVVETPVNLTKRQQEPRARNSAPIENKTAARLYVSAMEQMRSHAFAAKSSGLRSPRR
jgi:hypothetical protein